MSSDSISVLKGWFQTWKSSLRGWGHGWCACSLLLRPLDIFLSLKEKVLTWNFDLSGSRKCLWCVFSSPGIFKRFCLIEREGLDLGCWSSRLRACLCVLVYFTRDLQSSFFSLRIADLGLEGLSLRKIKFDLRDSLSLESDSSSLWNDFFYLVGIVFFHLRIPPKWWG